MMSFSNLTWLDLTYGVRLTSYMLYVIWYEVSFFMLFFFNNQGIKLRIYFKKKKEGKLKNMLLNLIYKTKKKIQDNVQILK
jgi:hypothetical protein